MYRISLAYLYSHRTFSSVIMMLRSLQWVLLLIFCRAFDSTDRLLADRMAAAVAPKKLQPVRCINICINYLIGPLHTTVRGVRLVCATRNRALFADRS